MEDMKKAFSALGNRRRLKLVTLLLESGEITVGQVSQRQRLSLQTASRHLRILESAGLLRSRQQGKYVYYSADTVSPSATVRGILTVIRRSPKRRIR